METEKWRQKWKREVETEKWKKRNGEIDAERKSLLLSTVENIKNQQSFFLNSSPNSVLWKETNHK